MIKKIFLWFRSLLDQWLAPYPEELVLHLILHIANLELTKTEYAHLAPMGELCGPFIVKGSSLPIIEYVVFEKNIMEFIRIRVEISRPDRMEFSATIESKHTSDPARHGEKVEVIQRYKVPFERLVVELYRYFPIYRAKGDGIKQEEIIV